MDIVRNKPKQKGIKRFVNSFKYAFDGLKYAFKYEQNMTAHLLAMLLAIFFGILLDLSYIEWLVVILIIGLVIATELINTSIEATIDLISPEDHPLAKIAKDTSAAAVLVFGLVAIVLAIIIYVPKLLVFIGVI